MSSRTQLSPLLLLGMLACNVTIAPANDDEDGGCLMLYENCIEDGGTAEVCSGVFERCNPGGTSPVTTGGDATGEASTISTSSSTSTDDDTTGIESDDSGTTMAVSVSESETATESTTMVKPPTGEGTTVGDDSSSSSTGSDISNSGAGGGSSSSSSSGSSSSGGEVGPGGPCNPFAQNCIDGYRCAPWSIEGVVYEANHCVEIVDDPGSFGDPCEIFGESLGGVDTCQAGAVCITNGESDTGVCWQMCGGSFDNPTCEGIIAAQECLSFNGGVLPLCLETCDPIAPSQCVGGLGCYPMSAGEAPFSCWIEGPGAVQDTCSAVSDCNNGLACVDPSVLSSCQGPGCCTEFCDLSAGPSECPAAQHECQPWFTAGSEPAGYEDVGFCGAPA